jgi:hypothetical protein
MRSWGKLLISSVKKRIDIVPFTSLAEDMAFARLNSIQH